MLQWTPLYLYHDEYIVTVNTSVFILQWVHYIKRTPQDFYHKYIMLQWTPLFVSQHHYIYITISKLCYSDHHSIYITMSALCYSDHPSIYIPSTICYTTVFISWVHYVTMNTNVFYHHDYIMF